jgi:hypothetical protein
MNHEGREFKAMWGPPQPAFPEPEQPARHVLMHQWDEDDRKMCRVIINPFSGLEQPRQHEAIVVRVGKGLYQINSTNGRTDRWDGGWRPLFALPEKTYRRGRIEITEEAMLMAINFERAMGLGAW